jgi:hypothetical protein
MANRDQATINFEVYEGKNRFLGIASATLPTLTFLTQSMSGAGIAGNINAVLVGQMDSMTLSLSFRNYTGECAKLATPELHQIELRIAQQVEDPTKGTLSTQVVKHVFKVIPTSLNAGSVAPASTGDPSGEYAVRYWATYVAGKKTMELDPFNNICLVNGTDYLASVRKALGI